MTTQAVGWWNQHGTHAATLLGPMLVIAALALAADVRAWLGRRQAPRPPTTMVLAAAFSALAALVHGVVCPEHFREAFIYGVFFAVSTVGQLAWSVLAVSRSDRWLAPLGMIGNAACVLLWVVTRSIGIPLGPDAGAVESVGLLDVVATTAEIGVVVLCAKAIGHHVHPWRTPRRNACATPSSSG